MMLIVEAINANVKVCPFCYRMMYVISIVDSDKGPIRINRITVTLLWFQMCQCSVIVEKDTRLHGNNLMLTNRPRAQHVTSRF